MDLECGRRLNRRFRPPVILRSETTNSPSMKQGLGLKETLRCAQSDNRYKWQFDTTGFLMHIQGNRLINDLYIFTVG